MTTAEVIQIGRDLMFTTILLALPTIMASLVVGILISVFQTITSIQEQTLSFAPRIIAVAIVIVFTLPWTLRVLVNFTLRMFYLVGEVG
jgi:flagellar biosynthetic protein FliQ